MSLTTKAQDRAQAAAAAAQSAASSAAQTASDAAQTAAQTASDTAQTAVQTATEAAQAAAQNAAVVASSVAQTVAQNASEAAQTAAVNVREGVRQGVFSARRWAAPRIESAADYTTATVAPKVAAALRSTAEQVNPPSTGSRAKSVLKWTALGAGIAAGLGAAFALVRFRFRAAIDADTEKADEDTTASDPTAKTAPVVPGVPADTPLNGQVSSYKS